MAPSTRQDEDLRLIERARSGDQDAFDAIINRYYSFVRLKARSYFLAGGDTEDLIQEGLFGLTKAIKDYREDRGSSFRNFAELCVTRQIITSIKAACRKKHSPLNNSLSFSHTPDGCTQGECRLEEILEGPAELDPFVRVTLIEDLESLMNCLNERLSALEASVLKLNLEGCSYEEIAARLGCSAKSVDNALQRIRLKVGNHLNSRD